MGRHGRARCLVAVYSVFLYGMASCSWIHGDGIYSTVNDQHSSRRETKSAAPSLEHKDLSSPVVEIEHDQPPKLKETLSLTGLEETGEWAKEVVPEILKNLPIDPLSDKTDGVHSTGNGNVTQFHDVVAGKMDEFHEKEQEPSHDQPVGEDAVHHEQHGGFGPFSNEMKSSPEEDHDYEWLDEPVQESVRPVEESVVPGMLQPEKPTKEQVLSQVETGLVYLMKTAHHAGITVQDIMGHLRNRLQTAVDRQPRNPREPEAIGGAM